MTAIIDSRRLSLYLEDHETLAARLAEKGECVDLLAVDAPYSARTHGGHDGTLPGGRSALPYSFWTDEDVARFLDLWVPLTRGWVVSITDHVLWPAWQRRAEELGLYANFPPVPIVIPGSRIRLRGDGPSPWSYFAMVARPKVLSTWGTLPGAHIGPRERLHMTGGKPLWLMREIVRLYSRPGDVVCDPVCGSGTTPAAALYEGREALAGDGASEPLMKAETRSLRALRAADDARSAGVPVERDEDEPEVDRASVQTEDEEARLEGLRFQSSTRVDRGEP